MSPEEQKLKLCCKKLKIDVSVKNKKITHNTNKYRFEIEMNGITAELVYKREDNKIFLMHTRVPESLEGQGIGTALAEYALQYALDKQLRLIVICPFVRGYISKNPEWREELIKNKNGKYQAKISSASSGGLGRFQDYPASLASDSW
jgi:predicted GNAT family acetyltransferase